jgi:hypothetical protein
MDFHFVCTTTTSRPLRGVAFALETHDTQMIERCFHTDCTNILELGDGIGNRNLAWSFGRFIPGIFAFAYLGDCMHGWMGGNGTGVRFNELMP